MLLPGSSRVDATSDGWMGHLPHRDGGYLQDCTAADCPYAVTVSGGGAAAGSNAALGSSWQSLWSAAVAWWKGSGSSIGNGTSAGGTGGGGSAPAVINIAPMPYGFPVSGVSAAATAARRVAAARLFATLAAPPAQLALMAQSNSSLVPYRRLSLAQLQAQAVAVAGAAAAAAAVDLRQLRDLNVVGDVMDSHPNAAPPLRLPGAERTWWVWGWRGHGRIPPLCVKVNAKIG